MLRKFLYLPPRWKTSSEAEGAPRFAVRPYAPLDRHKDTNNSVNSEPKEALSLNLEVPEDHYLPSSGSLDWLVQQQAISSDPALTELYSKVTESPERLVIYKNAQHRGMPIKL